MPQPTGFAKPRGKATAALRKILRSPAHVNGWRLYCALAANAHSPRRFIYRLKPMRMQLPVCRESIIFCAMAMEKHNQTSGAGAKPIARRIAVQLLVVVSLSSALGLTFNASNPIGVRWSSPTRVAPPELTLLSAAALSERSKEPVPSRPAEVQPGDVAMTPRATEAISNPSVPPAATVAVTPSTVSNAVSAAPTPAPPADLNPSPIKWAEAKPLVAANQAVLVDVRARPTYDAGHIPGALSLPESSTPGEFAAFIERHPPGTLLIVYCSNTGCSQSLRVANRLVREFKLASVRYMTGGYVEWQQAELARGNAPPPHTQPVANP